MFAFVLLDIIFLVILGAVFGLIPFLVGRYLRKQNTGILGMIVSVIACIFGGVLGGPAAGILFALFAAIGFTIALFVIREDFQIPGQSGGSSYRERDPGATRPAFGGGHQRGGGYGAGASVRCLSGPLRGRVYRIGSSGLLLGRANDCSICFPANTAAVSRHHCSLQWERGVLHLVDLGSTYGTFLEDGRQLPPRYPTAIAQGTCFYLGTRENVFQIV